MPHKAGNDFFKQKKEWSRRKDIILDYYLKPYLAKVAALGRPILIVDGFAGPGKFEDGDLGSPLVICEQAKVAALRGTTVKVLCIEQKRDLHSSLQENLKPFTFASARHGTFLSVLPEIESYASTHTIFLYVDPFTIDGVEWAALDRVFSHLARSGSSIEILFNFNVTSLVRRGLAVLNMQIAVPLDDVSENEDSTTPIDKLNQFAGGDWWIEILRRQSSFADAVTHVAREFSSRLASRFDVVCQHPVKAKVEHSCPKYILVFGSRSSDALLLMNEAMIKSRSALAESAAPNFGTLFENRPFEIVPDITRLPVLILELCSKKITRWELVVAIVRKNFCDFTETEIKRCIHQLAEAGKLKFLSDTSKMNDRTIFWKE